MHVNDRRDIDEVTRDLFARLDPGGALGEQIRAFTPVVNSRLGRGLLKLLKVDIDELARLVSASGELVGSMAEAVLTFGPAGWAPCARAPVVPYQTALRVYRETHSLEQAESVLVEAWNQPNRLGIALKPLGYIGAAHPPFREVFWRRAILIDKALKHHEAGAYEASVPIALAQLDGIVGDLLPDRRSFFHGRGQAEHLIDNETVAGLPEGLDLLRQLVASSSWETENTGRLSRHGIMHGRELGYDTLINSTKTFVLLLAVMEWAMPRAQELAARLHAEEEARNAGSAEVDERGRRIDRRGFDQAQTSLRKLSLRQMGEFRHHGQYGNDLDRMFPGPACDDDYLFNKARVTLETTSDRSEFWAWRTTTTGMTFGIAGRGGPPNQWFYAGSQAPVGGIDSPADWRSIMYSMHPDWM